MRSRLISHSARALSGASHRRAERAHHHPSHAPRRAVELGRRGDRPTDEWAPRRRLLSPVLFTGFGQRTQQSLITGAFATVTGPASGHHSALGDERAAEPRYRDASMVPFASRRRSPTHHHNRRVPRSAPRGN
jgi:hypothetical protein